MKKLITLLLTLSLIISILPTIDTFAQSEVNKNDQIIVSKDGIYEDDIYITLDGYKTYLGKTTLGDIVQNTDFEIYQCLMSLYDENYYKYKVGKKINIDNYDARASYEASKNSEWIVNPLYYYLKKDDFLVLLYFEYETTISNCVIEGVLQKDIIGKQEYPVLTIKDNNKDIRTDLSQYFNNLSTENLFYSIEINKNNPVKLWGIILTGDKEKDFTKIKEKFVDKFNNVRVIDDTIFIRMKWDGIFDENAQEAGLYDCGYWKWRLFTNSYLNLYYNIDLDTTYPFKSDLVVNEYKYFYIHYDGEYIYIGDIVNNSQLMSDKELKAEKKRFKQNKKYFNISQKEYNKRYKKWQKSEKNETTNSGKLYVGKYGIAKKEISSSFYKDEEKYFLYLDGHKYSDMTTIGKLIENTYYDLYEYFGISNASDYISTGERKIDVKKDKTAYESGQNLFLKNGKSDYRIYLISDNTKDYPYLKDMKWDFYSAPAKITTKNDYYLKKTFSIKNAPSLDNFKKEFMKKLSGDGKNLVTINKLDYEVGYSVLIPIISLAESPCNSYVQIIYKYDKTTRKCIEIDWDFFDIWDKNFTYRYLDKS